MGLWADLFARSARGEGALLSAGRSYADQAGGAPQFPDLGGVLDLEGAPVDLGAALHTGRPALVALYSNCCCGAAPLSNLEALARRFEGRADFVAVNVNGLVAHPPAWHPEATARGDGWPRKMAAELARRVGGVRAARHVVLDVQDGGRRLVGELGLETVPTHVFVGAQGQLLAVGRRGQLPSVGEVEALVAAGAA